MEPEPPLVEEEVVVFEPEPPPVEFDEEDEEAAAPGFGTTRVVKCALQSFCTDANLLKQLQDMAPQTHAVLTETYHVMHLDMRARFEAAEARFKAARQAAIDAREAALREGRAAPAAPPAIIDYVEEPWTTERVLQFMRVAAHEGATAARPRAGRSSRSRRSVEGSRRPWARVACRLAESFVGGMCQESCRVYSDECATALCRSSASVH